MSNYAFDDNSNRVPIGLTAYPVGSIYMSVNPTSSAELFGGTWEPLDQGRVLIGAGTSHPAGETGGEETHALTTAEMPSHNHTMNSAGSHSHSGETELVGDHSHSKGDMNIVGTFNAWTYRTFDNSSGAFAVTGSKDSDGWLGSNGNTEAYDYEFDASDGWTGNTSSAGSHSHSLSINSSGSHSHTINNTGGGGAHNNMQPYLAVYMWYRTA